MLPVVGFISVVRTSLKKTLKQPKTVLAFPHDETEIKQNCRRSAETKPRPSAVLFYFSFISPCPAGFRLVRTKQKSRSQKRFIGKIFPNDVILDYQAAPNICIFSTVLLLSYHPS